MKRQHILLPAIVISLLLLQLTFAAPPRYEVIDLGTLGGDLSGARSINNSGQIVGFAYNSSGYRRATLFDPTGNGNNLDLGTIGGSSSIARSINNSGQIVGTAISITEGWRATLFDESGMGNNINLGTLPGFQSSAASSINNSGQIVGWVYYGSAKSRAILFDPTGNGNNIDLGTYRSGASSINDRGQIVGATGEQAMLFDANGSGNNIYLGSLPGFYTSHALSINNSGQIVGVVHDRDERFRAVVFDPTGNGNNVNLDTLGGDNSEALSINNNGKIVGSADLFDPTGDEDNVDLSTLGGYNSEEYSINNNGKIMGSAETTIYYRRATLFGLTRRGHNIDLNTLIDPNCGWTLAVAYSINDNDWIVGSGRNPASHVHAFLMKPIPPRTYYADDNATGNNNGSSWADAFNYLQDALTAAYSGDEIRVAQGNYKPDQGTGTTPGDREATFQLINGVTLKGGYAGFGEPDPNDRDVEGYETMLSGDLDGDDVEVVNPEDLLGEPTRAENSKHVVTSSTADITTVFDGFSVIAANNNHNFGDYCDGGGMYNYNSSLIITNCTFSNNSAYDYGGGMHNHYGSPIISNCTFSNNFAYIGGGIQNWDSNSMLTNCILLGNSARETGGGMENHSNSTLINCIFSGNSAKGGGGLSNYYGGNSTLINCIFSGNSSTSSVYYGGGGIHNSWGSNLTLTNCTFAINSSPNGNALSCDSFHQMYPGNVQISNSIFRDGGNEIWNNDNSTITMTYSDVQGGWPGDGNIDADPCFVDLGYWDANGVWIDGDYRLLPDSPCIDAGDPNYITEPNETDLDGKPRIIGGRIDMGAYEYSPPIPAELRIVPRTINLASKGNWITCYIWLPEDYNLADIDPNSVFLEDEIQAESLNVDEQEQVAMAKFNRSEVQVILDVGDAELTVTGQLTDGTVFEGTDIIKVINKAGKN